MSIIEEIRQLWPMLSVLATVASVVAALFAGFCLYHLQKHFAGKADHEALAAEHDALAVEHAGHGGRIAALERRMETVPGQSDMHRMQLAIEEIRGNHKAMNAKIDGVADKIEILQRSVDLLVQSHIGE